ncbi:MAG TPA: hypothetical protein VM165_21295 [Planctomycetaceae bacterium]|nr:hypothetical protein [Planctomycetaceae bacterium]
MYSSRRFRIAASLAFVMTLSAAPIVFAQTTTILAVTPNAGNPSSQVDLFGTNFVVSGVGPSSVTIGGYPATFVVAADGATNDQLIVVVPHDVLVASPGTYQLRVSQSAAAGRTAIYEVTLPAAGVPGPKGDKGDTGDQGIQGATGTQGAQGPPGLLSSFDALAGLPCTSASGQASAVRFDGPQRIPTCPEPFSEPPPSAALTFSTMSLNFGLVACGAETGPQTFTVTNNSSQTLALTLTLTGGVGSPYFVSAPASLGAGAMGTVTVTPKPIPTTASTTPDGFGDSLSVNASGGPVNETHVVALHETAQGAILRFNPTSLFFTTSGTKAFAVNNAGNLNAPFTLTRNGSTQFLISPTSGNATAGGSSGSISATFNEPVVGGGSQSGNVQLGTTAGLCAPLPANLTLSGN